MDDFQATLMRACQQGRLTVVEHLLATSNDFPDLNYRDSKGLSPLMHGILAGRADMVNCLLQAGANANFDRPPHAITPLMLTAALTGPRYSSASITAIAQLLLENGAAVNRGNDDGTTALMIAAQRGNGALVKILLAAGADPHRGDRQGDRALALAIEHGDAEVVGLLMDHEAQTEIVDRWGNSVLVQAVQRGDWSIFQTLRQGEIPWDLGAWFLAASEPGQDRLAMVQAFIEAGWPVAVADDAGDTALHLACLEGNKAVVNTLLQAQAPVNAVNQAGDTPLLLAITQGWTAIVAQLLGAGADANLGATGETPLLMAIATDYEQPTVQVAIVEQLLAAGAKVNQGDGMGKTPLMWAGERNLPQVLAVLTRAGAAVNQTDQRGATALMWACHGGALEAVQWLLTLPQLDLTCKNRGGSTALDLAYLHRHRAVIALLESRTGKS